MSEARDQNAVSSEGQVAECVQNSARFMVANVENDEFTTVEHDIKFEIPLVGVGFIRKRTSNVRVAIDLTKTVLHPKTRLVDTRQSQI